MRVSLQEAKSKATMIIEATKQLDVIQNRLKLLNSYAPDKDTLVRVPLLIKDDRNQTKYFTFEVADQAVRKFCNEHLEKLFEKSKEKLRELGIDVD